MATGSTAKVDDIHTTGILEDWQADWSRFGAFISFWCWATTSGSTPTTCWLAEKSVFIYYMFDMPIIWEAQCRLSKTRLRFRTGAYQILVNPTSGWLTTTRRNFYQPVLVRIYCNCAIREAWLPFMTCILRTLLSGWSFLFMIYANCGAIAVIASTTYHAELFDEYPTPFSPKMMMIAIDHNTNIYIDDIILSMKTERSIKAYC